MTYLESVLNSAQSYDFNFQFSSYYSYDRRSSNRNIFFSQKYWFFEIWPAIKKTFGSKNWKSGFITLCRIQCRFQNCLYFYSSIVSFWLLFFWRFKNTFYGRGIYICIYWVLLECFEAINASNQETICSYMIFQPLCFISYLIFFCELGLFYAIFYNDVTTLLWRHSFFDRS